MSSSTAVHPTLHTSDANVAPPISITSGAIQYGVPLTSEEAKVSPSVSSPTEEEDPFVEDPFGFRARSRAAAGGAGFQTLGDAGVGELDDAGFRRQDVRALDVAVDDASLVQVREAVEHLRDVHRGEDSGTARTAPGLRFAARLPFSASSRTMYPNPALATVPRYRTTLGWRRSLRSSISPAIAARAAASRPREGSP